MTPEFYNERLKEGIKIDDAIQNGVDWVSVKDKMSLIINNEVRGRVLDAGCGTGWIAEFIDKDNYVGMDWWKEAVDEAQKRYPEHKFIIGDVSNTGFNNNSFDWVLAGSLGGYAPDGLGGEWDKFEKEWSRIAKKILVFWLSKPGQYKIIKYETI
jgi:SAM-dependent methyltransferase